MLGAAERMLAEVATVDDARGLINAAEQARVYAVQSKLGTVAVNHATVIKVRAERRLADIVDEGQARGEIAIPGDRANVRSPDISTLDSLGIDRQRLSEARVLRDRYTDEDLAAMQRKADDVDEVLSRQALLKRAANSNSDPLFTSESAEWNTPSEIVECVLQALGGIDLDPCSNTGIPNVPVGNHYTVNEDGLSKKWVGRVYMNPPYGRDIGDWIGKLRAEFCAGSVISAIALVPARTDTVWFRALRDYPVCFVSGRLRFSGSATSAPFPSAAFYLGNDRSAFLSAFQDIGDIWARVNAST